MLIYSKTISPRLQFITDFIFREILNEEYELTTDRFWFTHHVGNKINYSNESLSEQEFRIGNVSMLFQNEIIDQEIECFEWNGQKAFFKSDGDIPFDIFAAVFYLISRYEEYLPHDKDAYGRYAHSNSLAFKKDFLHLPLVDIWLEEFKKSLMGLYPSLRLKKSIFSFTPTYDIDIAWSYLHKGWKRTIGASMKDLMSLRWKKLVQRNKVLFGFKADPYDVYDWLDAMHAQHNLSPHYFFLVAEKYSRYDKNNPIDSQAMQDLIKRHDQEYKVGIHPSWQSGDDLLKIKNEILQLVKIAEEKIDSSRQHYIRFTLPDTYRHLIDAGIETDFSMGYGSVNGFRASTSKSFYWYDVKNEIQTELLLTPFCFMDANSFYEQRYTPIQAFEELNHYFEVLKSVNGNLVTIWHNTILGTESMYKGWREAYEKFVKEVSSYISSQ